MSASEPSSASSGGLLGRLSRPAQVIIVSSVMFTFISYWRTAAVVLCDLASTAYYIGGIAEHAIGRAAPWFILAVMVFSFAVRSVYIESCTMFIRGGVYRVVKEALGRFVAKFAVSALLFDYILTGPISGVSAGQYLVGLVLDALAYLNPELAIDSPDTRDAIRRWGSVVIACGITVYFYRQNILGLHESSDKALKIMVATTIMGVVVLAWCGVTLVTRGPANPLPAPRPDLSVKLEHEEEQGPDRVTEETRTKWRRDEAGQLVPRRDEQGQPVPAINEVTGHEDDPLGFLPHVLPSGIIEQLRHPPAWLSLIGLVGLFIAFGHSILAMSGEETLAQVYREVESPKLLNFKKAAMVVFIYSLALTGTISFLAVVLIPDEVRMKDYADNLIGGLAMYVVGPAWARLLLSMFVVGVGFLILAGAVNTAIIGSNGVLNRVAEDGVLPDWFLRPHPRYGTTSRLIKLIVGLQLFTIIVSRGHILVLGEAYAFGVVWSFVFQAISMVVLRFKDPRPREYMVPFNIPIGKYSLPVGLILIMLVLVVTAVLNLFTKEVATIGGLTFTVAFFLVFWLSEHYHEKRRQGARHEHLEQFNQQTSGALTPEALGMTQPYRKLVAIRSPHNLFMLEKALAETDPETTAVAVMTAKVIPSGDEREETPELDTYDQQLMTAVVQRAERAGKPIQPLIVPTNNPLHAVMQTAHDLKANELIVGASNKYTADEQLDQMSFYWMTMFHGSPPPLTVRVLGRERDIYLDLAGGSRVPKISERRARTVAELRAAGVGVDRVLMLHDGTQAASDLFQSVLTMLDPEVVLDLAPCEPQARENGGADRVRRNLEQARQLGREVATHASDDGPAAVIQRAREGGYDLIVVPLPADFGVTGQRPLDERTVYLLQHAHCPVFLAAAPVIPQEVVDTPS